MWLFFVFVRGFLTDIACGDYKVSLDNEDDAAYTEKKYFQEELK